VSNSPFRQLIAHRALAFLGNVSFFLPFFFSNIHSSVQSFLLKNCYVNQLSKKNKAGGITCPDLKEYCKATLVKTVWHCHENRHIDRWNRTESPELNLYLCSQPIIERPQRRHNGETVSSINGVEKTECSQAEAWNWILISYHVQKSTQWIKHLNIRAETTKLLGESRVKSCLTLAQEINSSTWPQSTSYTHRVDFSLLFAANSATKAKLDKWDYVNLKTYKSKSRQMGFPQTKSLCTAKKKLQRAKKAT
jgi:hypothetical protein